MGEIPLGLVYLTDAYTVGETVIPQTDRSWQVVLLVENPDRIAYRGSNIAEFAMREEISITETSQIIGGNYLEQAVQAILGDYTVFALSGDVLNYEALVRALDKATSENLDLVIDGTADRLSNFLFRSSLLTSGLPSEISSEDPRVNPERLTSWLQLASGSTAQTNFGISN